MLVNSRMTREPVSVSPDHTLARALRTAREHRVRHLPVIAGGELVGILSDRDIRLATPSPYTADGMDRDDFLDRTSVAEVMTREVITVGAADTVEDAAKALVRHRIGALPVVDAGNHLLGILTETDILHAFVEMLGGSGASTRLEARVCGYEVTGAGGGAPASGCGRISRVRLAMRARGRSFGAIRAVGG